MESQNQTFLNATYNDVKTVEPFVSVIVVNYNGKEFLKSCLDSILRVNYQNFETIFVDNHSTDGSVEYARKHYGREVKIIELEKNIGYGPALNIATKYSRGKYLVFLNADLEVDPNFLNELVKEMEQDASIGSAQCKIMCMDDRRRIASGGEVLDPYCTGAVSIWGGDIDDGSYNKKYEISYPMGAAMIIRRSLINKIGLFDPDWFADDGDIGWRTWLAGFRVVSIPTSIVYHKGQVSFKRIGPKKIFISTRSRPYLIIKNAERRQLIKLLPICLLFCFRDIFSLLSPTPLRARARALMQYSNIEGAKYAVLGLLSIVKHFKSIWKRRLQVQLLRKTPDGIIFKHFINIKNIPLFLTTPRSRWQLLVRGPNDYHFVIKPVKH